MSPKNKSKAGIFLSSKRIVKPVTAGMKPVNIDTLKATMAQNAIKQISAVFRLIFLMKY
jgi:hypothetical protein